MRTIIVMDAQATRREVTELHIKLDASTVEHSKLQVSDRAGSLLVCCTSCGSMMQGELTDCKAAAAREHAEIDACKRERV